MPRLKEPKVGERVQITLTYEDYCTLPDDGNQYELLRGKLHVTPSPLTIHQRVSRNLEFILHQHVSADKLGEVLYAPMDIILSESNVVQPDLLFIANDRLDIVTERNIQGAPTLVAEILSPSTNTRDRSLKMDVYAEHDVLHYWLLDPATKIFEEYVLEHENDGAPMFQLRTQKQGGTVVQTACFNELTLDLSAVWV